MMTIVFFFPGEHIHRGLHRPKGSADQDSASGVYAVCLQQWPQAEGVGLLQEGDSPGTVRSGFWFCVSPTKQNRAEFLCTVDC